jgi:hypothetical protein
MIRSLALFAATALLLIAIGTPWVVTRAAGTTLNALDYAEWSSLHPDVRARTPSLFVTLCLRASLLAAALLTALTPVPRWSRAVGVILLAVAALPPAQAITQLGDPNYQQQAALAAFALIGGLLLIALPLSERVRNTAIVILALAQLAAGGFGAVHGPVLMGSFDIPAQFGIGVLLMALSCALLLVTYLPALIARPRHAPALA